jgi:hypothetical protein
MLNSLPGHLLGPVSYCNLMFSVGINLYSRRNIKCVALPSDAAVRPCEKALRESFFSSS